MRRKLRKNIRRHVVYYIVIFFVALFRLIPRRAGIMLARLMTVVFYSLAVTYRKNTIRHLTMAFGQEKSEKQIRRLSRRVFLHLATVGVDAVRIPLYVKRGMDHLISVRNIHYLEQVRADGKGFILLAGHFGNWELMGAWLGQRQMNLHAVGAPLANPKINRLVMDVRKASGYIIIERGNATQGVITALTNGFPVALLIDQDIKAKGIYVDFFGRQAYTPIGPAALAGKLSVPVLPMTMRIKEDFTYELECFPPLYYDDTGDRENDILVLTQKCTNIYEQAIRGQPEQWPWMHRRWKRQPEPPLRNSRGDTAG